MEEPVDGWVQERVRSVMPGVRKDLESLVRIPSVGFDGFDPAHVRASAELTRDLLEGCGARARLLEADGAHPAVLAHVDGPDGAPAVLLYAHHDVQPPGPADLWSAGPFEPVERDGRLYGRGVSDDKAGIAMHLAALRAWQGKPPVGVTVFVEGEEECGSSNLGTFLAAARDELQADVVVLADGGTWRTGTPELTGSLRGVVACFVEVRVLDHAVHSGGFGGVFPDALMVLSRMLSTLHDDDGEVAVEGLVRGPAPTTDLTEEELRSYTGSRPGVALIGSGSLEERLWTKPAVSILGIDAPATFEAANRLVASARAKVSMRIPPGQDPAAAMSALQDHLRANVPWGAEVSFSGEDLGAPYILASDGPAYDAMRRAMLEAFGADAVAAGSGGSIPFVAEFAALLPNAELMITGAGDPQCNAHAEDESLDLGDLEKACLAEALFLQYLADGAAG
jgi:acetylornithine deacetylase/succinyl-diaminopimelate desuccinylase-like protein